MAEYSPDCGLWYQYFDDSTAYGVGSYNDFVVGADTYRVSLISIWCGPPYTFGRFVAYIYKNTIKIGECIWQDGVTSQESFDNGGLCVAYRYFDCVYEYCEIDVWWGRVCSTYNEVWVHSTSGDDNQCGNVTTYPVKTFGRAYALLNSGGIIHVKNSGAVFSGETVAYNKSFRIDLDGSTGNFFMPKT